MRASRFRELALAYPEAEENEHQGHPDFRVGGKVFATLAPADARPAWGMVRVPPPLQAELVREHPDAFEPVPGAWGKQGCTRVHLAKAKVGVVRDALEEAWRFRAPKKLLRELDEDE